MIAALVLATVASAASFEELAAQAGAAGDPTLLASALTLDCGRAQGELARLRCAALRERLGATIPARRFRAALKDDAIEVSEWDAATRAVTMRVTGCLSCEGRAPLVLRAAEPSRDGEAPVLLAGALPMASEAEAALWVQSVRPRLRAEVVFQPALEPSRGERRPGLTFRALGVRVVDRCTGQVLLSQPPSRQRAEAEPCAGGAAPSSEERLEELDGAAVNAALAPARAALDACLARGPAGSAPVLVFVVAPSGQARSVAVEGAAAGMPAAECLLDAVARVRFRPFAGEARRFRYPVVRRR